MSSYSIPMETKGLVVENVVDGVKLVPVILDNMRSDEILVEMKYSGICHTDVAASKGGFSMLPFPAALGHEGAGIIRAIGADVQDKSLSVGDSVILSYNHCGRCRNCLNGHPACCYEYEDANIVGRRLDDRSTPAKLPDGRPLISQFFGQSSFLRHSVVSQHTVVRCPYPENLGLYAGLGCGFQTGAGTVLNAFRLRPEDSIVVWGAGTVGIAAIMAARHLGIRRIIAVDLVRDKLELAQELGATDLVNASEVPNVVAEINRLTNGGADLVIECTGVPAVINKTLDCTCCGGTVAVVGAPPLSFQMDVAPLRLIHENKTVRGICQGDSIAKKFIPEMMELHRQGRFPLEKLCSFYKISEYDRAVAETKDGKTIKAILEWDEQSSRL